MKKDYFIDFSKNIITVSRSFFDEAAKDTESAAYSHKVEGSTSEKRKEVSL